MVFRELSEVKGGVCVRGKIRRNVDAKKKKN